ncbi:MAG: hypothetical protein JST89_16380 [Cyanobacteria bacterium SZAS-4]|nr:hypothetical protein [Cyanobacteria bacterium SZAS-4]
MFGFGKKKANSSVEEFKQRFVDNQLEMARARSKLYARVSHYDDLLEGEDYDVDLKAAYFKGLMGDEEVSFGPLQIVGTHDSKEFMWSWHNTSIPKEAYAELKPFVDATPELKELAAQKKFACDAEFVEKLSQWIAVKSGWLGAFEAPYETTLTFLLLKLTCEKDHSVEPSENLWCSFCGRTNRQVAKILTAAPTCAICDVCVGDYHDIVASNAQAKSEDKAAFEFTDIATMPPCIICGERSKRTFSEYGSACDECIEACHNTIAPNR